MNDLPTASRRDETLDEVDVEIIDASAANQAPEIALEPGFRVPGTPYRIDRWLGEGGMGDVFLATHMEIQRKVVLKALALRHCLDRRCVSTFRNEARACARIGAPNIVDIYDILELDDGRVILCMEYLPGSPLDELIDAPSFDLSRMLGVARQLCKGLSAAHAANIVHRDIKPANIIVGEHGGVRDFVTILDFGIATVNADLHADVPVAGTPEYIAPETLRRESVSGLADMYAVGVLLYEWACGRRPFEGTPRQVLSDQVKEPVPPLEPADGRHVPPALEALILRCLDKDPGRRFESMDELEAALIDVQLDLECVTTWDHLPLPNVSAERQAALARRFDELRKTPELPGPRVRPGRVFGLAAMIALGLVGAGYAAVNLAPDRPESAVLAAALQAKIEPSETPAASPTAPTAPADEMPAAPAPKIRDSAAPMTAAMVAMDALPAHTEPATRAAQTASTESASVGGPESEPESETDAHARRSKTTGLVERRLLAALEQRPDDVGAMDALAAHYLEHDRFRDSAKYARRAAEITPDDGRRWLKLGHAEYKLFRYAKALEAYTKAHELGDPFAKEHLDLVESKLSL